MLVTMMMMLALMANEYEHVENRIGGQNLGNVISQILLCKQINPDFQLEELGSITKDSKEIAKVLSEMQEFMPKQEAYMGKTFLSFIYMLLPLKKGSIITATNFSLQRHFFCVLI